MMLRERHPQFAQQGRDGGYSQQDAEECWSQLMHSLRECVQVGLPLQSHAEICCSMSHHARKYYYGGTIHGHSSATSVALLASRVLPEACLAADVAVGRRNCWPSRCCGFIAQWQSWQSWQSRQSTLSRHSLLCMTTTCCISRTNHCCVFAATVYSKYTGFLVNLVEVAQPIRMVYFAVAGP